MSVSLVFNDLCYRTPAENSQCAATLLEALSELLVNRRLKLNRRFVTPREFLSIPVAAGYPIGKWLAERRDSNPERRLLLKTIIDRRIDYEQCVPAEDLTFDQVDYRCGGETAKGLFVALFMDGLAISLPLSEEWEGTSLTIEKTWIADDDVKTCEFSITHASRKAHLDLHAEWLQRKQSVTPANGMALWDERAALFPSLDFCDCVARQVGDLRSTDTRFKAAVRGLQDLQTYCETWNSGNFDIHRLVRASGESESTLNRYSKERTFRCPDGQYRVFNWHLKRGDTRIHFIDVPHSRRILVGYVGPHLPIWTQ